MNSESESKDMLVRILISGELTPRDEEMSAWLVVAKRAERKRRARESKSSMRS